MSHTILMMITDMSHRSSATTDMSHTILMISIRVQGGVADARGTHAATIPQPLCTGLCL